MATLTGIWIIGTFIAFIFMLLRRDKQSVQTFIFALVVMLILAAMTGNNY